MHPATPLLTVQGLCFGHSAASLLFDRLELVLRPGVTWLGGGESTGKTTLLQLLAGALPASTVRGQVQFRGISLADHRQSYLQQVSWLDPRDDTLDAHTVRQVFATLPARHPGCDLDALQAHIAGLSLAPHLDKALYMLSTGSRRKVLLAAALAANATLTLLDQPFKALDRPSIDYLLTVLRQASAQQDRACMVADYEAPPGVALAGVVELQT